VLIVCCVCIYLLVSLKKCKQIPNFNFIAMRASLAALSDAMTVIEASMMHCTA